MPAPVSTGVPWSDLTSDMRAYIAQQYGISSQGQWDALSLTTQGNYLQAWEASLVGSVPGFLADPFSALAQALGGGAPAGTVTGQVQQGVQTGTSWAGNAVLSIVADIFKTIGSFLVSFVTGAVKAIGGTAGTHTLALVVAVVVLLVLFH